MKKILKLLAILSILVSLILLHILLPQFLAKQKKTSLVLAEVPFSSLPEWGKSTLKPSFLAFQKSCKSFLKQPADRSIGTRYIRLSVKSFQPACRAAMVLENPSEENTRSFFERWFQPMSFFQTVDIGVENKPGNAIPSDSKFELSDSCISLQKTKNLAPFTGLFTGYYMPHLQGSLTKTATYTVPIYNLPSDLVRISLQLINPNSRGRMLVGRLDGKTVYPYYTREEINKGAIKKTASVIAWVENYLDRFILEIEGSGVISLPNAEKLYIGYAGENGAPYTAIAGILIKQGVMTKDNASMQKVERYLNDNPELLHDILNQNKSFVFFRKLQQKGALGAQAVTLSDGYSLAVDRKWIPLGLPIWLSSTRPTEYGSEILPFHRLMIAQDTGGAIRGPVRGDIYWGEGEKARSIAGKMKNPGQYWLLMPKDAHYCDASGAALGP